MKILVINAGSSSLKYQLYLMPQSQVLAKGIVERIGDEDSKLIHSPGNKTYSISRTAPDHQAGMEWILTTLVHKEVGAIEDIQEIGAVGHRVVHGGEEFTGSVVITDNVMRSIEKFADLAPLHNPPNLIGIQAARHNLPHCPQVACFDTAFHSTISQVAYMYALPYEVYEKFHVRRYGFHGTSHRYVARRASELLGAGKYDLNVITCHLGNGCSITAIKNGRSIDTSMGLTPLEGLAMGTRSGDFDPAILFYLVDKGYKFDALKDLCNKKSGLLGLSGFSNDMRIVQEAAAGGNQRAKLAIDVFCYRVKKYIGAYAAVLNRLDALVFTGGIGENGTAIRALICEEMTQLGISLNSSKNQATVGKEGIISRTDSKVKILVIPTNEELAIAKDTYELAVADPVSESTNITSIISSHPPTPKVIGAK